MKNRLILCLYFLYILLIALYAFRKPTYNWDLLPYMAVVMGYDHNNSKFNHDTVYSIAKKQLPADTYSQLIDGGLDYRKRMMENENEFHRQLAFYEVKPFYTRLVYFFYKLGYPLIQATLLPSFISYLLIGFLVFIWIKSYVQILFALAISSLIMITAPLLDIVRSSSPDCLSSFFVLGAIYLIVENKSQLLTFLFLLISIFVRLDNVIPSIFLLSLITFYNKSGNRLPIKNYGWMLSLIILSYFLIALTTVRYGWSLFYYPTFLKWLNLSYTYNPIFHPKDYLELSISHIMTGLFFTNFLLFIILALLIITERSSYKFRNLNFDQLLVLVIILSIVVRFILQPIIADRFYIAYYLSILVLLIRKLNRVGNLINESNADIHGKRIV